MISDRIILKICLIGFLILFPSIYIIDANHTTKIKTINEISIKDLNKHIKITGIIHKQKLIQNNLFITIQNTKNNTIINNSLIQAIIFNTKNKLKTNLQYEFEGKISIYQKNPEIIIDEIKPLVSRN